MDYEEFGRLKGNEVGERLDIEKAFEWVLKGMKYEDFKKFATLRFKNNRVQAPYDFKYNYLIEEAEDSEETREEFIKYYFYKLIQNLYTDGIELL